MAKENLTPPDSEPQTWDEQWFPIVAEYWREICGGLLLLFSVFSLLALTDVEINRWLTYGTGLVRQLLGWGAYILFIALGVAGVQLLANRLQIKRIIPARIVVGTGLLFLLALPITHAALDATFSDALAGRAGGIAGWALTAPFDFFLGPLLFFLLYVFILGLAFVLLTGLSLDDVIRSLVFTSGRLRRWSEELAFDLDEEPIRTLANYHEPQHAPYRELAQEQLDWQPARLRPKSASAFESSPIAPPEPELPPFPPLSILTQGNHDGVTPAALEHSNNHSAKIIEQTLKDFGLDGDVIDIRSGPAVTQFGVEPGYIVRTDAKGHIVKSQKVRISQIANLRKDFALALAVPRLRIEAPVPGRGIVGIEVPNPQATMVRLRNVMESAEFQRLTSPLAVALGADVAGSSIAVDLTKMPHLLIAGTTGSGKSVCMKTLITSLIMHNSPETLKLVMVDPKRVEMIRFNGLPHLFGPAEVEGERIIGVLRWIVGEMEQRYAALSAANARQIKSYNKKMREEGLKPLPHIVVFIDELADLMVQYSAETERTLCRLAQMARATGIHLVVATQRPSTDVITGLIKANFPSRIAFAVASSMDSRVVLDTTGADQLLGNGDMLFLGADAAVPQRVQGCFVDDDEIDRIVEFWQAKYPDAGNQQPPWESLLARMKVIEDTDDEIEKAIELCQKYENISTSLIQRRLRVGFPRAARIMETLYEMGLVEDPKRGGKTRKTYVTDQDNDPLADFIADQDSDE